MCKCPATQETNFLCKLDYFLQHWENDLLKVCGLVSFCSSLLYCVLFQVRALNTLLIILFDCLIFKLDLGLRPWVEPPCKKIFLGNPSPLPSTHYKKFKTKDENRMKGFVGSARHLLGCVGREMLWASSNWLHIVLLNQQQVKLSEHR